MKSSILKNKLNDYIKAPNYFDVINHAVAIKGAWGAGKTYFIKHFLQENYDNNNYQIYISLFGLSDIKDLDQSIKSAFLPFIDNKLVKFVKENAESTFNIAEKIIKEEKVINGLSISKEMVCFLWKIGIDAIELYKRKDDKKVVFVIDDVERSKLPLNSIFGYFSNILACNYKEFDDDNKVIRDFNKNRVIFVLNPEEMDENTYDEYLGTKEKIIGSEFELDPEIKTVLESYHYEIKNRNSHITPDLINSTIKEVCETVHFYNLRMIKYTQQCISAILIELQKSNKKIEELYITTLVKYATVLMIQKVKGQIDSKVGIERSLQYYWVKNKLWTKTVKDNDFNGKFDLKWIPLHDLFYEILIDGNIDSEEINKNYINWKTVNIDKKSFDYLCSNYIYMDNKEFSRYYKKVYKTFENNQMLDMNQLFYFYELQVDLIDKEIIRDLKFEDLDLKFKDYLSRNKTNLIYENFRWDDSDLFELAHEYESSHNGKKMPDLMNEMIEMGLSYYNPEHFLNIFVEKYKEKDVAGLRSYIENVDPDYEEFVLPMLSKINLQEFFLYLIKFSTKEQLEIFDSFKKRYEEIIHLDESRPNSLLINSYIRDKDYIIKLAELYEDTKFDNEMNPANYMKKELSKKYSSLNDLYTPPVE